MSVWRKVSASLAVAAASMALGAASSAQEAGSQTRASTILVFDVSNSMWGQIDGVSKIEIARDVIGDMVRDWDEDVDLGLVAYGHRRKGDCSDIESVIPVGPVNASSFSQTVNGLVPRGRTPLTDAVREAARLLNYRDVPSTVILVSDGIESCNADPCALAQELERGGIDFTAHVIGFDVGGIEDQGQLSCLADETGGKYLTAENADELSEALRVVAAPPPPTLQLEAVTEAGGQPILDASIIWTLVSLDEEETLIDGEASARPSLEAEGGKYFARAELGDRVGATEFVYPGGEDAVYQVVLAVPVSLTALDEVEATEQFQVIWTGPNSNGDFIALAEPGADAMKFAAYARTSGGSPASFTAPDAPGDFVLRYVAATTGKVLAERPIAVLGAFAEIEAPPAVEAGSSFEVSWTAPGEQNDFVAIVPAGAEDREVGNYAYTRKGNPSVLRAQDVPGDYEVRYISGRSRAVLASLPIMVTPPAASLEAVPTVVEGANIDVSWTGPDNQNDTVIIVPAGAEDKARGTYAYTRNGNPAEVRAPDEAGAYELRYVTGQTRETLASLPITVVPASALLEAVPTATVGSEVAVTWTGPDNTNDTIIVVPSGAPMDARGTYAYTRNGNPAEVRMPDDAGSYELRYVTGQDRKVLASLPISVQAAEASLEAVPTAVAGSDVAVSWVGPDNTNDTVIVVPAGAAMDARGTYSYTRNGNPAMVRMPEDEGAYELRYVTGQDRKVLASLPIAVKGAQVSLEAPPVIGAGAEVPVTWVGPDNTNDHIDIVPAGSPEDERGTYAYTRNGNPAEVRVPDEPGAYELRYRSGQDRRMLAALPITVTEVQATLEAAPAANAGAEVPVNWIGPDTRNDHIIVVATGAPDDERGTYAYTRNGNPAKVTLPDDAGSYEFRYIMGQSRRVLASIPIEALSTSATLDAVPVAPAGSKIDVSWTGPDNRNDHIAIGTPGADGGQQQGYSYTRNGNPASVKLPEAPGSYELRYVTGQDKKVLQRLPITVN